MNATLLSEQDCQHLLNGTLPHERAIRLMARAGFADPEAARLALQKMAAGPEGGRWPARFLAPLLLALSKAASPDRVLVNLERMAQNVPNRRAFFKTLAQNPRALQILVTLFAGSQFLTEILLGAPHYFERLGNHRALARPQSRADFAQKARAAIEPVSGPDAQLDALRRFQRWQLLRIGTGDLLGLLNLPTITAQLSHLADALVQVCLSLAARHTGTDPAGFVVLGMGKLGGEELNYSSDIDLLFLAAGNAASFERLGKRLIDALTRVTAAGFLYRVDMRLRPWGKMGALVTPVEGHLAYLQRQARRWEKQALLKARVVAGEGAVGGHFLQRAAPLIMAATPQQAQTDIRAMKQRIETNLRRQGRQWGEVKLGQGSIRDIEFVTQYLQLAHGSARPHLLTPNTLRAMRRLAQDNLLTPDEYRILSDGYTFLRSVEHWLQMLHYRQTHTLPTDPGELADLARRLGFTDGNAKDTFLARYEQHTIAIRLVYQSHLEPEAANASPSPAPKAPPPPMLQKHLARLSPAYITTFSQTDIERHAALAERISPDNPVEVDAIPLNEGRWQVTIVGYDYLGELSLICGLLFVYGLTILEGHVFTYQPLKKPAPGRSAPPPPPRPWEQRSPAQTGDGPGRKNGRQKIVDVFIVHPARQEISADTWPRYAADLAALLQYLEAGRQQQAQGQLAKRLAALYRQTSPPAGILYPVDIEVDNTTSGKFTLLRIDTVDTIGFLYELTNALALAQTYIARVTIGTAGSHVHDTLYIADRQGNKITSPARLRELRAATVLTKHFTHLLPRSPNPEAALLHFRQFLSQLFARPNWPDELISLERPQVLEALARLLGVSDFLWADFFRMQYANLFPVVRDVDSLVTAKSKTQLHADLESQLRAAPDGAARRNILNAFKDREMFRTDMRHIMGYTARFGQFSAELTGLAEVVVKAATRLCRQELVARHGEPALKTGRPCSLSLCALGKCGGHELGFASDIELMFVYGGNGHTAGPETISTPEFFEKLVQAVLNAIQAKRKGVFEIDLRLRPYGSAGSLAVSLDAFRQYYAPGGPAWPYERQALVKLRPIAGDADFGRQLVALRDDFVYNGDPFDVAAMRGMRERQIRHLVTPGTINVKLSPGGLVDVEYLVQGLQITHGRDNPYLRITNTRQAMAALAEIGLLSAQDYAQLKETHIFLRRLINALRIVHGHAKDLTVPPADSEELVFLARRLDYGPNPAALRRHLTRHMAAVQDISARLLG